MSDAPVLFDNVSKKFRRGELHDSLRDLVPAMSRRLFRRGGGSAEELEQGDFWAVRDVSFDVRPGEALGIIGPNGAGKSTILKLLTRILRPTRGMCRLEGRVGALIEIAAGFHQDLTGRENVFLQGAIMGMSRDQIRRRFDEIVHLAGIGEFIDTPVKRYSSGMNARLGFSIAAHLEPEVLIIDEVLSVGDWSFQARAYDRIHELVTNSGIPVVVVSHQLERIASLCTKAILLDRGRVMHEGPPAECIERYVTTNWSGDEDDHTDAPAVIRGATLLTEQPAESGSVARMRLQGTVHRPSGPEDVAVSMRVRALHTGEYVFFSETVELGLALPDRGDFTLDIDLGMHVPPGLYGVELTIYDHWRRRTLKRGPTVTIEVGGGPTFLGRVQMSPRVRLVSHAETLPPRSASAV